VRPPPPLSYAVELTWSRHRFFLLPGRSVFLCQQPLTLLLAFWLRRLFFSFTPPFFLLFGRGLCGSLFLTFLCASTLTIPMFFSPSGSDLFSDFWVAAFFATFFDSVSSSPTQGVFFRGSSIASGGFLFPGQLIDSFPLCFLRFQLLHVLPVLFVSSLCHYLTVVDVLLHFPSRLPPAPGGLRSFSD